MAIGTSKGAFYEDEFHYETENWNSVKNFNLNSDQNVLNPDTPDAGTFSDNTERFTRDNNVVTPPQMKMNQNLDNAELDPTTGLGIEVGYKTASPLVNITDKDIDNAIDVTMSAGSGIIAGVASKTADTMARMKAAVMEGKGVPAETVQKETGWFKGSDGRRRYEISDEGLKLVDRDWKYGETGKLSEFVDHPKLFEAYPHLKDIDFKVAEKDFPYLGSYNDASKTLTIHPDKIRGGDEGLLDVISHELQHAVQSKEGFSPGSNPDNALGKALIAAHGADKSLFSDILDMGNLRKFAEYMYQRAPGEVEANNVAARRKLTDSQRKEFTPQDTVKFLEGSDNSLTGGKYYPEFNYPTP